MEKLEKIFINAIILAMAITFGYHAVNSLVHHNYDMATINAIIAYIVLAVGKSIKKLC